MNDDQPLSSPRRSPRLQFSLLSLLIVMTLVGLGVAWLARPKRCEAIALFQVSARQPTLLVDRSLDRGASDLQVLQRSLLELLRTDFVLSAAIRSPAIASLPTLSSREDPVEWLAQNLDVQFPQNSEILSISLSGPEARAEDLRQIVDAVANAFRSEVIYAERQRSLVVRDATVHSARKLREDLARKITDLKAAVEAEPDGVEARLLQIEVELLTETWRDLMKATTQADIDRDAPDRIIQLQPAIVRPK